MVPDRHIVLGVGGTAIVSPSVVVLVDAVPDSDAVRRSGVVVADAPDAGVLVDRLATVHRSFAVAAASAEGVAVTVAGDCVATTADGEEVRHRSGDGTSASATFAADARIVLALAGTQRPTGQWLTSGVIAAGAVVVGRLRAPGPRPTAAATPTSTAAATSSATPVTTPDIAATPAPKAGPTPRSASAAGRPDASAGHIDFGSLVGAPSGVGTGSGGANSSGPADEVPGVPSESDGPSSSGRARTDPTAAYVPGAAPGTDPDAVPAGDGSDPDAELRWGGLVFSDGQRASLDAPVVVGRRPPSDPVAGAPPHQITVDDRLLSRHHATFRVLDGHLVVIDEESTNGTFVTLPGGVRERCAVGRPIEVPAGATVDIGGVVTVTHDRGPREPGSSSC